MIFLLKDDSSDRTLVIYLVQYYRMNTLLFALTLVPVVVFAADCSKFTIGQCDRSVLEERKRQDCLVIDLQVLGSLGS